MPINQAHSRASHLVAFWAHKTKRAASLFDVKTLWEEGDEKFRLEFKSDNATDWAIRVSFYRVEGHPEWMRVSSTNWRCEDEPNDIYKIEDCRAFYKELIGAGFTTF